MPLDPSIALGIKPPQIDDPATVQQRKLTLGALQGNLQMQQMQMEQAKQQQAQQMQLADVYRQAYGADGKFDPQAFDTQAARQGLGAMLPGIQKQRGETALTQTKVSAEQWDLAKKKNDASASSLASLISLGPRATNDDAIQSIQGLVGAGLMSQEEGAQAARTLPGDPRKLQDHFKKLMYQVASNDERLKALTPHIEYKQTGKQLVPVDTNAVTNPNQQALAMTTTPGEDQSASTTMRGQNMSAATAARGQNMSSASAAADRAQREGAVTYQQDASGNYVALPTRGIPGQPVQGTPVMGPGGVPLAGKSAELGAEQGKNTSLYAQADNAWKNMQATMKASKPGKMEVFDKMPIFGDAVANWSRSPDRQKFVQASKSLSEAFLHAATGAGFSADEARNKMQEITPQLTDSAEVIAQKMAAIPIYLDTLKLRAGPGAKSVDAPVSRGTPAAATAALPTGWSVTPLAPGRK